MDGVLRDVQALAVEPRALAALGGEHLVVIGIVDHGVRHDAVDRQCDGDGAVVQAADKVHRAVDGVDDEQLTPARDVMRRVLLPEEARLRQQCQQAAAQEFLHHGVIQRDEVDMRGFFADAHGGILRRTDRRARRADDVLQTFQKMDVHSFFAPDPAAAAAHFLTSLSYHISREKGRIGRKSSRIPFQMPGRAAGKGRRPHFPEQQNCRNGKKHPPLVLGNFILPYGKSLWISFSQVSNFILHPVTIFIVWQPIIYIFS